MVDYLQPVGKAWRIASIVGCTLTSIICFLLSLLLWTDMIRQRSFDYQGKPLWIGAAIVGLIGVAAGFIAWRLLRGHAAGNGVTVLPASFIQLFGVLLLVGLCFVADDTISVLVMVLFVFVCLEMIFVGKRIAKRQR
jgi:H+/Cl- antiporter ClcA